jgi:hypothetical protein
MGGHTASDGYTGPSAVRQRMKDSEDCRVPLEDAEPLSCQLKPMIQVSGQEGGHAAFLESSEFEPLLRTTESYR